LVAPRQQNFLPSARAKVASGRAPARRVGRDRRRAAVIGLALAALIGSGIFVGSQLLPIPTARPSGHTAAELASGPVLFLPRSGNDCRQRVIDNATWQMRDNGVVDCDAALLQNDAAVPRGGSLSRTDAIRNGFRRQ
jgi:hypothetical protein